MTEIVTQAPFLLKDFHRIQFAPSTIGTFIVGLIYLRWFAGIAENFGAPPVSEFAAMILMVALGMLFLLRMTISRSSALLVAGLLAWTFTGILSFSINEVSAPVKSLTLLALLLLYGLFANACFTHLSQPSAQPYLQKFLTVFIVGGSVLSIYQIGTATGFIEAGKAQIQRAIGSDVHPVSFAIQILAAMVAFECLRAKRGQRFSFWYCLIIILGLLALYLTFARTAWIMAIMTTGYAILMRSTWFTRAALLSVFIPISLVALASSDRFTDLNSLSFFWSNFSLDNLVFDYRFVDNSVSWRIVNWGYGLQQAMEQPLLGFGPGQSAASSYFKLEMHNIFLETFFEGGVIGLSAFFIVLCGLISIHRGLASTTRADKYSKAMANGFGLSLLAAVVLSTSFVDQLMSFLLYILLLTIATTPSEIRVSAGLKIYR